MSEARSPLSQIQPQGEIPEEGRKKHILQKGYLSITQLYFQVLVVAGGHL